MFGAKDKPAKPAQERRCPFLPLAGGSLACVQDKCAVWQDEAGACAFNVLARAVTATERPEA